MSIPSKSHLPIISSMWIGPKLSFLEQLCLKSFLDAGHRTKLYVYGNVSGIPDGVEVESANNILPTRNFIFNKTLGSPGPHADKFRYQLLTKTDEIWVDTDAYCLRPFLKSDYLIASHYKGFVANGVLRLPKSSPTLKDLATFTQNEYPDLPNDFTALDGQFRADYDRHRNNNKPMHISEMPWEVWGPFAITYFLKKNDEFKYLVSRKTLYPLGGGEIFKVLQKPWRAKINIPDYCISIHFYGSNIRKKLMLRSGCVPQENSLLGQLCAKHNIDPTQSPIIERT